MSTEYQLSIEPVKTRELPPEELLLSQGRALVDGASSWKEGKTFHKVVHTYSRPKFKGESADWHCRISEHTSEEATFDEMWSKLGPDKGVNEVNYVEEVKKATLIKQVTPSQAIWSMYYKFPPPVSPRVFNILQTIHLSDSSPRTGIIVSIPVDLSSDPELAKMEEPGVKGRYVSVEQIKELENGKIEWRMATASRAEGFIPQFLTERSMPSAISSDVTGFIKWLKKLREEASDKAPEQPATQEPAAVAPIEEPSTAVAQPGADTTNLAPVVISPAAGMLGGPVP